MRVACEHAIAVVDLHDETESELSSDEGHATRRRRGDLRSAGCRDVDAEVWTDHMKQRMPPRAREAARDRADYGKPFDPADTRPLLSRTLGAARRGLEPRRQQLRRPAPRPGRCHIGLWHSRHRARDGVHRLGELREGERERVFDDEQTRAKHLAFFSSEHLGRANGDDERGCSRDRSDEQCHHRAEHESRLPPRDVERPRGRAGHRRHEQELPRTPCERHGLGAWPLLGDRWQGRSERLGTEPNDVGGHAPLDDLERVNRVDVPGRTLRRRHPPSGCSSGFRSRAASSAIHRLPADASARGRSRRRLPARGSSA